MSGREGEYLFEDPPGPLLTSQSHPGSSYGQLVVALAVDSIQLVASFQHS